jgi:hypothetical protein
MKRIVFIFTFCSVLALGAFAVLLVEDRRLGVPLPYSAPLAFGAMLVVPVTPLMFSRKLRAVSKKLMAHRSAPTAPVTSKPVVTKPVRRARAEGTVLLDFSRVKVVRGRAA